MPRGMRLERRCRALVGFLPPPPNSTLKPSRPVFGRAAEPPLAEQYSLGVRLVAVRILRGMFVAATTPPLFASPRGHRPRSLV
jgi:hypothetical protein